MLRRAAMLMSTRITYTYATWNPIDKGTNNVLSNGNLTSTIAGAGNSVRATVGVSSGKSVAEFTIVTATGAGIELGVANLSANLANEAESDANYWMYYGYNGNKQNNSSVAYGASYTEGDVIRMELDRGAGSLVFFKNNVSQGTAFTGLTGTLYPAQSSGSSSGNSVTANFGSSPWVNTPTAGFVGFHN